MARRLALIVVLALAGAARADGVDGFVVEGHAELRGHVTDLAGAPAAGVKVHVVSANGTAQDVVTERDGAYRVTPVGDYSLVYVEGKHRIVGQTSATDRGGVIAVHEQMAPAVPAKPLGHTDLILDYSDAAIDGDVWVRAWLLLAVDTKGDVSAVKLLDDPGYDLGPIAVHGAFGLRFEPARDRAGHAVRSVVMWAYEWPSYWWLVSGNRPVTRLPPPSDLRDVPCEGTDSPSVRHRACSQPNLAGMLTKPWLPRAK
jgi:hypothetical protein